ncbi:ketohexokinase [Elysia marginata]|uniref:Ketohexokinase n=1 Tax=Elysia marginata TaxID=1093978 RepID=A0AAV4HC59_9GAST|nr:ketohexokinase [Elysia marginata]
MSASGEILSGRETGKVLCVGLACVDFVNVVASFPLEDSDKRGERYFWQRGGNATNNCTVLTKLSTPCDFMGVLGSKGVEASWIAEDFERCGISTVHCVRKDVQCSIATVILSIDRGTRTIVFYPRDQPQLTFDEFDKEFGGNFSAYSWIHFELTSNVTDVCSMMNSVLASQAKGKPDFDEDAMKTKSDVEGSARDVASRSRQCPVVSLEIEKPEINDAGKDRMKLRRHDILPPPLPFEAAEVEI